MRTTVMTTQETGVSTFDPLPDTCVKLSQCTGIWQTGALLHSSQNEDNNMTRDLADGWPHNSRKKGVCRCWLSAQQQRSGEVAIKC